MNFKKFLFFIPLFCLLNTVYAQVKQEKDSAGIYRKIETYSKRSKFSKWLHKSIFQPVENENPRDFVKKKPARNLSRYQGKIIRKINITSLDPFGYSETNTKKKPKNFGEKAGNAVHIRTKDFVIKNLLLLRKNEALDTFDLKESERIIRSQRFIGRVRITPIALESTKDSIDLDVRVVDSWSIIPQFSGNTSRTTIDVQERNFLGFGHDWRNRVTYRFTDNENAYQTRYTIPNFKNTFIRTSIFYQNDLSDFYSKGVNIERPFYSPLTRWAGGVYFDQQFRQDSIPDATNNFELQNFKYHSEDLWLGRAFKIFDGNSEDALTTNLIVSARYLNIGFQESPTEAFDPANFFSDEKLFLGSVGIASRQFAEDKFLFNYGVVEDVAVGKVFGFTFGQRRKNFRNRTYLGFRAAYGDYFEIGYLGANLEGGSFFKEFNSEQAAVTLTVNYFSPLILLGDWSIRQFIKPQVIMGFERSNSYGDKVTLNQSSMFLGNYGAGEIGPNPAGLSGFNAPLVGTHKFVLSFQTQSYAPWQLIGFRFNPFFNYSGGVLGNSLAGMLNNKLYSKIGAGLIISNDYLVFSSFQISFAYYANVPPGTINQFQTNSFQTTDLRLEDFDFGKPRTIIYK